MISWVGATFVVIGFLALMHVFRLIALAQDVGVTARRALGLFRDPTVTDDIKEKQMQRYALALFKLFFLITLGSAFSLGLPIVVIWCLERLGVVTVEEVIATSLSIRFLLATTVIGVAVVVCRRFRHGL